MILMRAHDFLDQAIIENDAFVPYYESGSIKTAVLEIIRLMNITIQKRPLQIKIDKSMLDAIPTMKFDKRRLQ